MNYVVIMQWFFVFYGAFRFGEDVRAYYRRNKRHLEVIWSRD